VSDILEKNQIIDTLDTEARISSLDSPPRQRLHVTDLIVILLELTLEIVLDGLN